LVDHRRDLAVRFATSAASYAQWTGPVAKDPDDDVIGRVQLSFGCWCRSDVLAEC